MIATKCDNNNEIFPILDEQGHVIGEATRGECHSGSMLLHPVVHLQIFNSQGEIYLQRRPSWKDIQPDRWDTAVGGHVDLGETTIQALRREACEELGIEGFEAKEFASYIFQSSIEREYVSSFYTIYDGEIKPSAEVAEGRFWSLDEIRHAISKGGIITENFAHEFEKFSHLSISILPQS